MQKETISCPAIVLPKPAIALFYSTSVCALIRISFLLSNNCLLAQLLAANEMPVTWGKIMAMSRIDLCVECVALLIAMPKQRELACRAELSWFAAVTHQYFFCGSGQNGASTSLELLLSEYITHNKAAKAIWRL